MKEIWYNSTKFVLLLGLAACSTTTTLTRETPRSQPKKSTASPKSVSTPTLSARSASGVEISSQDRSQFAEASKLAQSGDRAQLSRSRTLLLGMLQRSPRFVEAQVNLGLIMASMGDDLAAERYFRQALVDVPQYLPACSSLAQILNRQGRGSYAIEMLTQCVKGKTKKEPELAEAYLVLANLHWRSGNNREALQDLQQVFQSVPDEPRSLTLMGRIYLGEQKYYQAQIFFKKALTKANRVQAAKIHHHFARSFMALGEPEQAVLHWEEAIKLNPNFADPHLHLGRLALAHGDTQAAKEHLQQIVTLYPQRPSYHVLLGLAHRQAGDFASAEIEYFQALRLKAQDPEAYYNLAVLYHKHRKDPEKAILFYQRYAQLDPQGAKSKEFIELMNEANRERQRKKKPKEF